MYSYGPLHMVEQKQGDQLEPTYSNSVRIRDVALRTCRMWRTIRRGGEKGSGISLLLARQDDDDDDEILPPTKITKNKTKKKTRKINKHANIIWSVIVCCSKKVKLSPFSRGWPEGPIFNSYYTKMLGRVLLLSLDCSTLPLIHTLYRWVLS